MGYSELRAYYRTLDPPTEPDNAPDPETSEPALPSGFTADEQTYREVANFFRRIQEYQRP